MLCNNDLKPALLYISIYTIRQPGFFASKTEMMFFKRKCPVSKEKVDFSVSQHN